jgi:3-oxoacyl-[acyl-carrier protein] reductase
MDLTGKTIIVTGASSGIGQDACVCLSELGARVVLVGRDTARLNETLTLLEGSNHVAEHFDLTNVDKIPSWLKELSQRFGPVHGLVHCAGLFMIRPLQIWQIKESLQITTVNVSAALALTRGFRQRGVSGTGGSIVYVSSVAGLVGQSGFADYSATKGAIISMTRSIALELAPLGIRANCVAPGTVDGPMVERNKHLLTEQQHAALKARHVLGPGRPRDVANAIAFLLADTARWITGTTLVVDGGFSC